MTGQTRADSIRGGLLAAAITLAAITLPAAAASANPGRAFQNVQAALNDRELLGMLPAFPAARRPDDLLTSVQEWLIWTGHYVGTVDGALGKGTIEGLRKFQAANGLDITGVLSLDELRSLARQGIAAAKDAGFALNLDAPTGVRMGVPKALLPDYATDGWQSQFTATDGRAKLVLQAIPSTLSPPQMLNVVLAGLKDVNVSYSASRKNWFVIAGSRASQQVYLRFQAVNGHYAGFATVYDSDMAAQYSSALTMMSLTLDTQTPNAKAAKDSSFAMVINAIAATAIKAKPPEAPEAKPLAHLNYDGKTPATMVFRDLTITLDSELDKEERDALAKAAAEKAAVTKDGTANKDASVTPSTKPAPEFGPSKDPVARLAFADGRLLDLKIEEHSSDEPGSDVNIYQLDRAAPFPQVVMSYFTGGAHCCTVTRIMTLDSAGKPVVIEGDTLDGNRGYLFKDLDGDGNIELLSIDNSFLYRFASYSESSAPLRIQRLKGEQLIDITTEPASRPVLRRHLAELENADAESQKSNGYLGGWVAAKAQLGQFREAWSKMLITYTKNPDWPLQECRNDAETCADNQKRDLTFPEALAKHLLKHGYISAGDMREPLASAQSAKAAKAAKASALDECSSSGLAVRKLMMRQLTSPRIAADDASGAITTNDDFTVDAIDRSINKTMCSVTVEIDLRELVAEMARRSEMSMASELGQLAARRGAQLSKRVLFTVQPTSKPGQSWVTILN